MMKFRWLSKRMRAVSLGLVVILPACGAELSVEKAASVAAQVQCESREPAGADSEGFLASNLLFVNTSWYALPDSGQIRSGEADEYGYRSFDLGGGEELLSGPAVGALTTSDAELQALQALSGSRLLVGFGPAPDDAPLFGPTLVIRPEDDGGASIFLKCLYEPQERILEQLAANRQQSAAAMFEALAAGDRSIVEQLAALEQPAPLPSWTDTDPYGRALHLGDTPPEILGALDVRKLRFELGDAWRDSGLAVCPHSPLGWNDCFDPSNTFAPTSGHVLVQAGEAVELWLLPRERLLAVQLAQLRDTAVLVGSIGGDQLVVDGETIVRPVTSVDPNAAREAYERGETTTLFSAD